MIIGDYQEELGGQHQHQHQEQVKGEAKDAMERLLPPRPSSSNSCNHHNDYDDCNHDFDEFDGHYDGKAATTKTVELKLI